MKKFNKLHLILSSIIVLLPILAGIILWEKLPQQLPVHWGVNNQPDRYAAKAFVVFGLPIFLLAVHWLALFATTKDKKNKGQNPKIMGMTMWIVPLLSVVVNGITYFTAMGEMPNVGLVLMMMFGVIFVIAGNFMPKCLPNRTIGLRIKWTLESEANWITTHRFTGKVWVIGGVCCFAGALLPQDIIMWVAPGVFLIMVIVPIIYSYSYYKKHGVEGEKDENCE